MKRRKAKINKNRTSATTAAASPALALLPACTDQCEQIFSDNCVASNATLLATHQPPCSDSLQSRIHLCQPAPATRDSVTHTETLLRLDSPTAASTSPRRFAAACDAPHWSAPRACCRSCGGSETHATMQATTGMHRTHSSSDDTWAISAFMRYMLRMLQKNNEGEGCGTAESACGKLSRRSGTADGRRE